MKIDWLKPLLGAPGPFVTVYIDATRSAEAGDREIENRWQSVRRPLEKDGAPSGLLDLVGEVVVRPTRIAVPHGRVVVANGTGVLVDRTTKEPPAVQQASYGPVPALLEAAEAAGRVVDHLVVVVDRLGADITRVDGGVPNGAESVDGGHDAVNKVHSGGLSHRRIEARAEDSWERNAEVVAAEIERQVTAHRPELVLLTGDVRAVGLVRHELGRATLARVVDIPGGGRGAGANGESFHARVAEALDAHRARRREEVLDEYREEHGRATGGITGLADVIAVLARGQVKELLLAQDTDPAARTAWVGVEPLHIASSRTLLAEIPGVEDPRELPAAVALVRAALGQDAGLTFVPGDALRLVDGVGAVLRWHDEGTPKGDLASMSTDGTRLTTL